MALLALIFSGGCANPLVTGYTGQSMPALAEDAPVLVVGADVRNPVAMAKFVDAMDRARGDRSLLGTSTAVAARPLRDKTAADAARQLGADAVFYTYEYVTSTIERSTSFEHSRDRKGNVDVSEQTDDTTRHWYEYQASFFGPPTGQ